MYDKDTYTYIIKAGNYVKIGVTKSVLRRFTQINKDCPLEISIVRTYGPMERKYAYKLEHYLHLHFENIKEKGEWFIHENTLADQMDSLLSDVNVTDLPGLIEYEKLKKRGSQQDTARNLGHENVK